MKPKVWIDEKEKCLKIVSDPENKITITEAHSFIKDFISAIYDYHKYYPEKKVYDYIRENQNA